MKGVIASVLLAGALVSAVPAQAQGVDLDGALAVEWAVANCKGEINGLVVMVASMAINGSDQAMIAERRKSVHGRIKSGIDQTFGGDMQKACADLIAHFNYQAAKAVRQ